MPILTKESLPEETQKHYTDNDPTRANSRWWKIEDKELIYTGIWSVTNEILLNLNIRRRMNYFFSTLYNDIGAAFTSSQNVNLYYNRTALDGNAISNSRMTMNVLQNVIDTACSLIAKNKPKPQFLTDGAKDYNTKCRGKLLTKYIEGVFDKTHMYKIMQRVFQDACTYGTGALKLYEEDGEIKAEWVYIEEILVDDLEGMHQDPQQMHQRKYVPRDILASQFPEKVAEIYSATQVAGGAATFSTADIIPVIESWHKPSGKKAKDGLHTICIENATLFEEEYKKDYFPIQIFRWADQTLGFWGRGICHEIWKLQLELDTLLRLVQQSMRLVGGPVIAVESGSNIAEDHITSNKVAKILEYTITAPQFLVPPTCQPEIFSHIQFIKSSMYEIPGVSESAATGNKPTEVKSGAAIREASDVAAGRFEIVGQRYETLALDIALVIVDMSADIVKSNKDLSVLTKGKKGADRLYFKDAMVDIEDMDLQLFPISGLSKTPAGRLDQLMDYAQAGYLSKEQVLDVVDFPDLEDTTDLETAAIHLTQQILSNIKEKGKYMAPGPYLNLPLAYRMACLEVDRATLDHVDEANIDLLRNFANDTKDLMDASAAQLQPAQAQPNAGTASQNAAPAQTAPPAAPPAAPQGT